MMKRMFKLRSLALLLLALSITACKKGCDDEPVPQDPCANFKGKFTASDVRIFNLGGLLYNDKGNLVEDTVFIGEHRHFQDSISGFNVNFNLRGIFDSVKWKIGTDPRTFTESSFRLDFDGNALPFERIMVKAFVFRHPNPTCLANDNGRDTITKSFVLVPTIYIRNRVSPMLGFFKGYVVGRETDTFTIKVHKFSDLNGRRTQDYIYNIPKGNTGLSDDFLNRGATDQGEVVDYWLSYRAYINTAGSRSRVLPETMFCHLTHPDSIIVQYQESELGTGRRLAISRFVGVRVR